MEIVYTKTELTNALNAGVKHVVCKGDIAKILIERRKSKNKSRRRRAIGGGLIAAVCIAAAPFTLGTSLGAGAIVGMGTVATGLTIGSCTMTALELAIICDTIVSLAGHKLHCNYNIDSSVDVDVN